MKITAVHADEKRLYTTIIDTVVCTFVVSALSYKIQHRQSVCHQNDHANKKNKTSIDPSIFEQPLCSLHTFWPLRSNESNHKNTKNMATVRDDLKTIYCKIVTLLL